MIIARVQVEEGFLDGLDLHLTPGLNVLIGPRGSGKTSIIELIRFCLGSKALTDKAAQSSKQHAASILGSGQVTVTLLEGTREIVVSRSSEHWLQSGLSGLVLPLVLSQNEIESVGLDAAGRLRLLDSVRPHGLTQPSTDETASLAFIRSRSEERRNLTSELQVIRIQIREIREHLSVANQLKEQHTQALASIEKARPQTERLNTLSSWLAALSVRTNVFQRTLSGIRQWRDGLTSLRNAAPVAEAWPPAAQGEDPLTMVRDLQLRAQQEIDSVLARTRQADTVLSGLIQANSSQMLAYEEESRTLRRELDSLQQGAGEIARRLAHLKAQEGQLAALLGLEKTKEFALQQVQNDRKLRLDYVEAIRSQRFTERSAVVTSLNAKLGPRIRITIERAGQTSEYAGAIISALRGSGLRFNEVAPLIADQMSPREFIEAVENEDVDTLAVVTSISPARAAKIIERINEQGVDSILSTPIEDGLSLYLLDGLEYKATEQLSTGQRCTAILPILLHQDPLSLLVDQPEDHLDNGFIVDTLINSLVSRKGDGQMIFSTHNPNIPVLGDAERVVLLGSDGHRGFVKHSGALDEPETVKAITRVMEGGIEAFDRRSRFYHGGGN